MAEGTDLEVMADPSTWTPMRPYRGRRTFAIRDPVVEPFWSGTRVIAHVDRETAGSGPRPIRLLEDLGADVAPELLELSTALGASVRAFDAVVDGVISSQVGLSGVGAAPVPEVHAARIGSLMRGRAELDIVPRTTPGSAAPGGETVGFIAFDLLRVDGATLLDVPLLERKRLLESVVAESELIRVSVHVRPPVETWVSTWKALGLRGGILKASNSRYTPGASSIEWRMVETVGRRRP